MTTSLGSTANNSHRPNKTGPRLPISARSWTYAQRVLERAGISQRDIADLSGVPLPTVNRALSLRWCGRTRYDSVLRVRVTAERLLANAKILERAGPLWTEYDTPLLEAIPL